MKKAFSLMVRSCERLVYTFDTWFCGEKQEMVTPMIPHPLKGREMGRVLMALAWKYWALA
jgi:hypothetical protein